MNINYNITPQIIRTWDLPRLNKLAKDIRARITEVVLKRGGHLAPSLGVVELTIALHYVFDTPKDKIIWDVGHQSYAHKLITGRWNEFETLRTLNGIAGFPKRKESEYDVFDSGHSGNSISVALGLVSAAKFTKDAEKIIAVIGDGSIVTGMAFEALNYAGASHDNLIVVLNDNEMSIGKSTGAMAKYLNRMITGKMYNRLKADTWNLLGILPKNISRKTRLAAKKIELGLKNLIAPSVIFEEMGFRYLGPFDGHNLLQLIENFQKIKNLSGPTLVHIVTKKGKGYEPAEKEPEKYHGIAPIMNPPQADKIQNSKFANMGDVFGKALIELAEKDSKICAISAGMCLGTGLFEFKKKFPDRFFDVGICEQHAVTFAAGLALKGLKPVVAIYSTFLARAYDQIIQDVALQNLPVIFAIDRAGIVGEDGPTHHGLFDISYLRAIPNLIIAAPKDSNELVNMLKLALQANLPFAIRYPKGCLHCPEMSERILKNTKFIKATEYTEDTDAVFHRNDNSVISVPSVANIDFFRALSELNNPLQIGKGEIIDKFNIQARTAKKSLCVLTIGSMVIPCYQALKILESETQRTTENERWSMVTLVNMRFVKPLDEKLLTQLIPSHDIIITVEENTLNGGFGSAIMETQQKNSNFIRLGLQDNFIGQGTREELLDQYGLSLVKLKDKFKQVLDTI